MARGQSGKFVIVLEPEVKKVLYAALAEDGLHLKDWFRTRVESYLAEREQPELPWTARESADSAAKLSDRSIKP
jgi:hypothetical protein